MATRKLEIEVIGDTKSLERALGRAGNASSKFGRVAKAGALAAGAGIAYGLGKVAKIGWDEFNQGQKVAAQTNAVLKSTGGVANVTAKHVETLGKALMLKSGVDDEVIKSGQNLLLTFTRIRNEGAGGVRQVNLAIKEQTEAQAHLNKVAETAGKNSARFANAQVRLKVAQEGVNTAYGRGTNIFDQATEATLDMSVAMGKDLNSTTIMVGKALNDPIKGLTSLTRVGVAFTDQQKEMITKMVESGNVMGAQKIILGELRKEFGGSAEAAGKTFGGQINILRERFNNWAGDMVGKAIPVLQRFGQWLMPIVEKAVRIVGNIIETHVKPAFASMTDVIEENMPAIRRIAEDIVAYFKFMWRIAGPIWKLLFVKVIPFALGITIKAIDDFRGEIATIAGFVRASIDKVKTIWDRFKTWITIKALQTVLKILEPFSHLPGKLGGWARDAKDRINKSLNDIRLDAANRKLNTFKKHWESLHDRKLTITVNAGINVAGMALRPSDVFGPQNRATGGWMQQATPGGVYRIAEAGYDEAVLSTDPRHKKRTYGLISEVIRRLEPRSAVLPGFAEGGFTMSQGGRAVGRLDDRAIWASRLAVQFAAMGMPTNIAYAEARRMERLHRPYLWGGGHAGFSSSGPWDCSGAVSQVLHKAGLLGGAPMVSGALMGWGKSGRGPLTVFANQGHTFMSILGKGFGTSGENPGGGWGDLSYNSRGGFAARTYDRGGWLPPGLSLAYNGTGRAEPVGGAAVINFNFPHYVGSRQELRRAMEQELREASRRGATAGWGG